MLQGKKAYICSPLSAPNPEGVQHNMELAKYYLMQMKRFLIMPKQQEYCQCIIKNQILRYQETKI